MPIELGLDLEEVASWFPHEQEAPYTLVRVPEERARTWGDILGIPVRRCYVSDNLLQKQSADIGRSQKELIAARLPDPGSVMSGDFGEIVVYLYQAVRAHPAPVLGAKKWRLKQDRAKPAPHSDVIHFVVPHWPQASADDAILCAEVKAKATDTEFAPVLSAIEGCSRDRTSRLAKTLQWLQERALFEPHGVPLEVIERFVHAAEHPPATKQFRAVAVVCSSLIEGELKDAPTTQPQEYSVVVIAVPHLRDTYMKVFEAARSGEVVANPGQDPVTGAPRP